MIRGVLWLALVAMVLGLSGLAWLVAESLGPTPGANMVLMGLPAFALLVLLGALAAHWAVGFGEAGLTSWERRAGRAAVWFVLALLGLPALVGFVSSIVWGGGRRT